MLTAVGISTVGWGPADPEAPADPSAVDLSVSPGITLLVAHAEDQSGPRDISALLRVLAGQQPSLTGSVTGGPCALLSAPPGEEWQDHDRVTHALGADHLIGREMWAMSAGERQRARVATLLADPAPILIFEEPFSLLDGPTVERVQAAWRAAAHAGRAIVVVSAADPRAALVADRVITLT